MSLSMDTPKRQAQKILLAMATVVVVAAKRASRKLKAAAPATREEWRVELRSKKKLLSNIRSKAVPFLRGKKKKQRDEDFGKGGVWQKTIMMGDKCEPLDFSGVIYYDSNGKQVNELPNKSPRATASPVPDYYFIRHRELRHHL
ncbi:hypothetical protein VNO78_02689 [Psophocarpus tetragonolobus]|uniref:Uncharacterized protein n=1 Tax=Psophocarpus tetragonolobus TaxID=3891 RepID=A0AAN9XV91_PSOTE